MTTPAVMPKPLLPACPRCGGLYMPTPEGQAVHVIVFGHEPRERSKWERITGRNRDTTE